MRLNLVRLAQNRFWSVQVGSDWIKWARAEVTRRVCCLLAGFLQLPSTVPRFDGSRNRRRNFFRDAVLRVPAGRRRTENSAPRISCHSTRKTLGAAWLSACANEKNGMASSTNNILASSWDEKCHVFLDPRKTNQLPLAEEEDHYLERDYMQKYIPDFSIKVMSWRRCHW